MKRRVRKIRRRLTPTGFVFVVCGILSLMASLNSGINLYYLIFAAIASFIFFSFTLTRRALLHLDVAREAPKAVNRNEQFGVFVRITNRRRLLPVAAIRIQRAGAPEKPAAFMLTIPAGRTAQARYTESFARRGVHNLGALELVTSFPFGIVQARREVSVNTEVLVYPRIHAVRTSLLDQLRGIGELPKVAQGHGDEFFSLREYVPGDDVRFISWRASARTGKLYVKELELQTSRFVVIVFDTRFIPDVADYPGRFEEAVELAASIAATLINRQYRVAIVTPTLTLREGEGASQILKMLELLARIGPADAKAPDPFESALHDTDSHAVSILLVSPDPSKWGELTSPGRPRVLDPREVVHA